MIHKIAFVLAVGLTLVFAFQGFYPDLMGPLSNVFPPVIAGAATVLAFLALRRYGRDSKRFFAVWLCFALGMMLWFLGEFAWAFYNFVLNIEIPYPSIADIFWLSGYAPFFAALYLYVKIFASALTKRTLSIVMAIIAVLSVLVSAGLVIPLIGVEEDLATLAVDFAYPLLDLALLSAAFLGLAVFQEGRLGKPWLFINAGIFSNVCGDFLFSYVTAQGAYYNGHAIDLLYLYGYLFFMLAFYSHMKEL
ncbi:MAG: hypothetical protein QHH24_01820 [Candidatus Bathyarchaeota archaeon]|nr:hypothetical protein [Candidatus Bathyarchaeota archaeon]